MPPRSFGDAFRLTLLTDCPRQAARADAAGVDRVGVDVERLGKAERQQGHDTRLSGHALQDLVALKPALARARLFARLNPLHGATPQEVDEALACGAQELMLPYFRGPRAVERFVAAVDGRARVLILVETAAALVRLRDILAVDGVDEVMVGLNDLRLEMRVEHHFEVLASPLMEMLAAEVHRAGLPLGIGGVARPDARLPVDPDLVLAQYPRLGASGAWISRSFFEGLAEGDAALAQAVQRLRQRLTAWSQATPQQQEAARRELLGALRALGGGRDRG